MNEQNMVVESEQTPKRRRTAPKVKKSGQEIIAEINGLQKAVDELDAAMVTLETGSVIHELASKELNSKRKELEDSLNTLYVYA